MVRAAECSFPVWSDFNLENFLGQVQSQLSEEEKQQVTPCMSREGKDSSPTLGFFLRRGPTSLFSFFPGFYPQLIFFFTMSYNKAQSWETGQPSHYLRIREMSILTDPTSCWSFFFFFFFSWKYKVDWIKNSAECALGAHSPCLWRADIGDFFKCV